MMKNILAFMFLVVVVSCNKKDNPIPQPDNEKGIINFKVHAIFTIGDIVYDSVPADLQIKSWDEKGNVHFQQFQLNPGKNNLTLPLSFVKNEFTLTHWNISETRTFTKGMITEGLTIDMGGSRPAKKLKEQIIYKNVNGNEVLKNKILYSYNTNNMLSRISYFETDAQTNSLIADGYLELTYAGALIVGASKYNAAGVWQTYTEFTYNSSNNIEHMHEMAGNYDIFASAGYTFQNGIAKTTIDYLYTSGIAATYEMTYKDGNKIKDKMVSSTSSSTAGEYTYDLNINPFIHIKLPDLYLSNHSRNNIKTETQLYSGNIPSGAIPYSHNYWIGIDGYPVEQITNYKSYATGKHSFNTRIVYTYY